MSVLQKMNPACPPKVCENVTCREREGQGDLEAGHSTILSCSLSKVKGYLSVQQIEVKFLCRGREAGVLS